jgi:hypothetical protein
MKTVNLQDALRRSPFAPFEVRLDSGLVIAVKHPELVMFSESETTVIVVEGEHFHIFDVANIASLRLPKKAKAPPKA